VWPAIEFLAPGGLALGLIGVALLIFIAEMRNPAFRSVSRLTRALGLPVFASIPRIDKDDIYEEPPGDDLDAKLVVHTAPESSPAEQYRGFLPILLDAEDCRVILVTSAARGDGKTLTCMNLATTVAADLNKRVLVIDGDLRRPSAHRLLHITRQRGLSDILLGRQQLEACAVNSKIPNLALLPAGPSVRKPLTLLTSQAFLDLLDEAKKSYDLVFIDSPPLLPVVDTKILRKIADMVLFVVRADGTPRDAVVRSLGELRDVAGVVFNQVSPGSFRRYYYYDAYSRYAYGEDVLDEREHG
jgi:capsular exopolysaccharide synthesis family protein